MNKWAYWIKAGLLMVAYIAMAGALFGIFQALVNGTLTFTNVATTALYYALPLSSLLICFSNITKITFMANVVISMGEIRKNALIGINIMNISMIVTFVAATYVLNLITGGSLIDLYTTFVVIPAIYLLAMGCGMFINSLKADGTAEANTVQSVLMLLSMVLLFGLHSILGTFLTDSFFDVSEELMLGATIFSIVAGILLYVIGNIRMKKKIMHLEVSL